MNAFSMALKILFRDKNISKEAIFYPKIGQNKTVRVILKQPDLYQEIGQSFIKTSTFLLEVQRSDCPILCEGDQFQMGTVLYTIQGQPLLDNENLIWKVDCYAS
jgi:hypothetical protein